MKCSKRINSANWNLVKGGHYAISKAIWYVNPVSHISNRFISIAETCCFSPAVNYGASIQRMVVVSRGVLIGQMELLVEIDCKLFL